MPPHARDTVSRWTLTLEGAVATARAAAHDEAVLVFLVADDDGVLVAVRPHDVHPADVADACRNLLGLLGGRARGPAVLVSVDSGLGTEPATAAAAWPDVCRALADAGVSLLDWLLVEGERSSSVAAGVASAAAESGPFDLAEDEEILEVGFSHGLSGTDDWGAGAWYFAVKADVDDAERALRAAVADHLATPGSNPNGYAFNWGDAMSEMPDEMWARHGLRRLRIPVRRSIAVDHDETFTDGDDEPS